MVASIADKNVVCDMSDFKSIGGTVRARAATELRDRILTGRLRPGTRLDLDEISREFGISRTPVREALLELSYEGLVTVTPRSGITVHGITPEAELQALHQLAGEVAGAEDVVAANGRFHRAVNHAAGSRRLLVYLRQAVQVVPASYFELFPEQVRRSETDHALLLEAIDRGDAAAARTLAEAHVLDAGAALGDWLRERSIDPEVVPI
jgi:DNA-binding GntR family transcriptional regulator